MQQQQVAMEDGPLLDSQVRVKIANTGVAD